jgi:hypothetical protein
MTISADMKFSDAALAEDYDDTSGWPFHEAAWVASSAI